MFERIQFNNISKPSDLTIWYTDDDKDERNNLLEWLSERLPEGVNFEAGAHGDNLNQKLHEKEEAGSLTKHNIFISGGSVKFETTDWEAKPSSTQVRDNYHGSLDVIKDHEPQLLGQGGHYYTAVYSQAFANNPMSFDSLSDDYPLDLPNAGFTSYGDFDSGGPEKIMTFSKRSDDAVDRFVGMIKHFDDFIGMDLPADSVATNNFDKIVQTNEAGIYLPTQTAQKMMEEGVRRIVNPEQRFGDIDKPQEGDCLVVPYAITGVILPILDRTQPGEELGEPLLFKYENGQWVRYFTFMDGSHITADRSDYTLSDKQIEEVKAYPYHISPGLKQLQEGDMFTRSEERGTETPYVVKTVDQNKNEVHCVKLYSNRVRVIPGAIYDNLISRRVDKHVVAPEHQVERSDGPLAMHVVKVKDFIDKSE